jgi:hypothetical protein
VYPWLPVAARAAHLTPATASSCSERLSGHGTHLTCKQCLPPRKVQLQNFKLCEPYAATNGRKYPSITYERVHSDPTRLYPWFPGLMFGLFSFSYERVSTLPGWPLVPWSYDTNANHQKWRVLETLPGCTLGSLVLFDNCNASIREGRKDPTRLYLWFPGLMMMARAYERV